MRRHAWTLALGALTALCAQAAPVRADAIDGDWCSGDGRQLSIQGPSIVTPGGSRLQGAYSRHAFVYVTPAGEPQGGEEVSMQLLGETAVNVRVGGASPQVWRRCTATTS